MKSDLRFNAATRDLVVVVMATLTVGAVCVVLDLSERLAAWTQARERYQLDELPLILLFVACGLAWFAWRRMREARLEIERRLRAEASLQDAFECNRRLAHANLKLQEDERRHLARELHDELGQCMNAIKIEAVALKTLRGDDETRRAAAAIMTLVDRVQGATRDIVRRLRPPGIDDLGLSAVLEHCVDDWRRRMPGVHFELHTLTGDDPRIDEAITMAVYRLVQEGLTNVARHARPRRVAIDLGERANAAGGACDLVLTIDNDGAKSESKPGSGGLGIVGMRERVQALGGEFAARFHPGDVFRVEASLPLGFARGMEASR